MSRLLHALLLATALLLGGVGAGAAERCAVEDGILVAASNEGLGGTGHSDAHGGLGGTGRGSEAGGLGGTGRSDASGLGGTGLGGDEGGIGGTGIFGTITGFGSICVNGLRVHYDADAEVTRAGDALDAAALRVGQVVWVEAAAREGGLFADTIELVSAVRGPIEEADTASRLLRVAGEAVEVPREATVKRDGLEIAFGSLAVGEWVEVSALRSAHGALVASRVDVGETGAEASVAPTPSEWIAAADALERVSIEALVSEVLEPGLVRAGALVVELPPSMDPGPVLGPDARLWVNGTPTGPGRIRAESLRILPPPEPPQARMLPRLRPDWTFVVGTPLPMREAYTPPAVTPTVERERRTRRVERVADPLALAPQPTVAPPEPQIDPVTVPKFQGPKPGTVGDFRPARPNPASRQSLRRARTR